MTFSAIEETKIHFKKSSYSITGKTNTYDNKKNIIGQDKNYTILKDNEFDRFCVEFRGTRTLVVETQYMCYKLEYNLNVKLKRTASSFRFWFHRLPNAGNFRCQNILTERKTIKIKKHILLINVPFLSGMEMFMEHGISMTFEKHQLVRKNGKRNIPLLYIRGHVYIG